MLHTKVITPAVSVKVHLNNGLKRGFFLRSLLKTYLLILHIVSPRKKSFFFGSELGRADGAVKRDAPCLTLTCLLLSVHATEARAECALAFCP